MHETETEEAEEEIEVPYRERTSNIGFNITYLVDVLANLSSERVNLAFGDANSSALVTMPGRERLQVRRDADENLNPIKTRPQG